MVERISGVCGEDTPIIVCENMMYSSSGQWPVCIA